MIDLKNFPIVFFLLGIALKNKTLSHKKVTPGTKGSRIEQKGRASNKKVTSWVTPAAEGSRLRQKGRSDLQKGHVGSGLFFFNQLLGAHFKL